jgi:aspartyl-tRNA(Asn)/glutamyl-tRNA(Gln) amidotransferase subunit C
MSVDPDTVRKIARLARIQLDEAQVNPLAMELTGILGWVEQLAEVNTDGVAPMTAVIPNTLRWREDKVTDGGYQADVLANAPGAESGFFAVPKVVE